MMKYPKTIDTLLYKRIDKSTNFWCRDRNEPFAVWYFDDLYALS